jgi:hypothetical protein
MTTITVRQATPDDATALARMLACQHVLATSIGAMDGQPIGFACLRLVSHLQGDEPYAETRSLPHRLEGVSQGSRVPGPLPPSPPRPWAREDSPNTTRAKLHEFFDSTGSPQNGVELA